MVPASRGRGVSWHRGQDYIISPHAEGMEETSTVQAKGQCICLHAEPL